jgi:GntR family transcriptional repressor for pyruvate dehydrogenase complex
VVKIEKSGGEHHSHAQATETMRRIVQALRADSLKCAEGALIGSEDQLLERHGVSRPTLRKAAALVAQEQLLQVRRGVAGGYIARRPTSRAVTHMAAIFLTTRQIDTDQIITSMNPIRSELARLAAKNLDAAARQGFLDFLDRDQQPSGESSEMLAFAKREREFGRVLGTASGNAVLSLFLEILYDLAANISRERDIYLNRPDRITAYRNQRRRLVEAILERDPGLAELLSHRLNELNRHWMMEDSGQEIYPDPTTDGHAEGQPSP